MIMMIMKIMMYSVITRSQEGKDYTFVKIIPSPKVMVLTCTESRLEKHHKRKPINCPAFLITICSVKISQS